MRNRSAVIASNTTSATSAGSSTTPDARTTLLEGPAPGTSPAFNMLVFTPCGHRQLTRMPASP
jgi:hypothetical protein